MICPKCNTQNEAGHQFCINCGTLLTGSANQTGIPAAPLAKTPGELLAVLTIRLVILLVGLWLFKEIIIALPFTQELTIPRMPIRLPILINCVVYLVVIVLLIGYARSLNSLWRQAFPRFADLAAIFAAIVYLLALVAAYYALRPIILAFATDPYILLVFQAVLFIIALVLIIRVGVILYMRLPDWLSNLRMERMLSSGSHEVACLHCGRLNAMQAKYCSACGSELAKG
jgi:hypothetical protein